MPWNIFRTSVGICLFSLISIISMSGGQHTRRVAVTTEANECTSQTCLDEETKAKVLPICPTVQERILFNHLPNGNGNHSAGIMRTVDLISNLQDCVRLCCQVEICNFAILRNRTCQLFFCSNGVDACMPKKVISNSLHNEESKEKRLDEIRLVLVRPPLENKRPNSSCETGADVNCGSNTECFPKNSRSRNGFCGCKVEPEPFMFNSQWNCESVPTSDFLNSVQENVTAIPAFSSPTPPPLKTIEVEVASKNITLPQNEADLYAYALPQSTPDSPYSYEWKLISHPDKDPATTEGQTTQQLHLTHLIQGIYTFQVTVKSHNASGSATVTIRVNPPKRKNQPPVAIISPPSQTIQMPTNSAVLDGTSSTDDDRIVTYKWELQKGPINFQFPSSIPLQNSSTLQVNDLVPGNYTFKLTVEDVDHATNETTANLTVIKEIDYPPTANAGKDIVIYLPQTEVTLNGNASTDDKKIVQWEWKATGDMKKAVDMQDTHTAYLKLSGLEEGLYQFELTVTDDGGHVSNPSVVHLFVKKPTGKPPTADAGTAQTIALPQTWVMLDGSGSKGDSKVVSWNWTQLSGPNNASLNGSDQVKVNVSGLTKGTYEFRLDIEDDAKLRGNATVQVIVSQKINEPPKANAGKDVTLTLPLSLVELDGSRSKDDVEIKEWSWERQSDSLAAGIILGNSDKSPILKLGNLVPGKYVFKLTVKDEQGLKDKDEVTLLLVEDPMRKNLIKVVLGVPVSHFTENERVEFFQKMTLLVHDTKLVFYSLSHGWNSKFTMIYLYGLSLKNQTLDPLGLSSELRDKLQRNVGLLDFPVKSIETLLCLNPCSGHGTCQEEWDGRQCVCDAFWMENYIQRHFGDGDRNCGWSKIYVGVILCFIFLMNLSIIWSLVYLFRRNGPRIRERFSRKMDGGFLNGSKRNLLKSVGNNGLSPSSQKNNEYTLIDDDEELELDSREGMDDSEDSESDESLIFERGKESSSKGVSVSLLNKNSSHHAPQASFNGLPRNGILKKPRPGVKT